MNTWSQIVLGYDQVGIASLNARDLCFEESLQSHLQELLKNPTDIPSMKGHRIQKGNSAMQAPALRLRILG